MGKKGRIGEIAQALAIYNSSSSDLKERLARISTAGGVAFYDVGQGACQAAIDDEMLIPQLYVDFGGGGGSRTKRHSPMVLLVSASPATPWSFCLIGIGITGLQFKGGLRP